MASLPPRHVVVKLQGTGDLSDYWPNNNEQCYLNTSNYCCYSVGRGRCENENTEGAERSLPGKVCRSLVTLPSEKGFNQQLQICRTRRKNECIVHSIDFFTLPLAWGTQITPLITTLPQEGLLVGVRSGYSIHPNTVQGISPKETSSFPPGALTLL